jgi:hypothetical protein
VCVCVCVVCGLWCVCVCVCEEHQRTPTRNDVDGKIRRLNLEMLVIIKYESGYLTI